MTDDAGARAIELLIEQAWAAMRECRYSAARAAAQRAVQAAETYGEPGLLIRALDREAAALRMAGDHVAALARHTRILGLAEDPAGRGAVADDTTARAVAFARLGGVRRVRGRDRGAGAVRGARRRRAVADRHRAPGLARRGPAAARLGSPSVG